MTALIKSVVGRVKLLSIEFLEATTVLLCRPQSWLGGWMAAVCDVLTVGTSRSEEPPLDL